MLEDATQALAATAARRNPTCALTDWIATLSDDDQRIAWSLVKNGDHNNMDLARYFQSKGAKVNNQTVSRHRNKRCCGQRVARRA